MGEFWTQIVGQVRDLADRLSTRQKVVVASVAAVSILGLALMVLWVRHPEYELLFANLTPEDAAKIVEKLKEEGTPYKLERGGAAVLVSSKKVYELRLELASQGLPKSTGVGYEIFDKTNIGMSDFVQKLNYRRALEGELTRTIQQLDEVHQARIHIVIPESKLFEEDQQEPTASIVLRLRPSATLSKAQIQGICHLIASSVEGLGPESVTIVDSYGNILSDRRETEPFIGLTASQLELQRSVESHLVKKAQSLLDGVLGMGNALVRVNAELNFDRMERTTERYDPDSPVVRSEERIEGTTYGDSAGTSPDRNETVLTNYEINKTVEVIANMAGTVKRLSVAVIVNGSVAEEEVANLTTIVQNAVGYDAARDDQIEVVYHPFDTTRLDQERAEMAQAESQGRWMLRARWAGMGLFGVALLLLLRSLLGNLRTKEPELLEDGTPRPALPEMEFESELPPPELQQKAQIHQRILHLAGERPAEVTRLFKVWLMEEI